MTGFLRMPPGRRPAPVVVLFNGTNAVKEELHWWADVLLDRGLHMGGVGYYPRTRFIHADTGKVRQWNGS